MTAPRTWFAFQDLDKRQDFANNADTWGFTLTKVIAAQDVPSDLTDCDLLFLDQTLDANPSPPKIYSLAQANPEVAIVVILPAPRHVWVTRLIEAGAFAVIDESNIASVDVLQIVNAVKRIIDMRQKQNLLAAAVAQQDKIAAMGLLAAGVSHEVNNPCAAILHNVTSLREDLEALMARPLFQRAEALERFAADAIDALSDCIGAGNRIADIVRTLNLYARREDPLAGGANGPVNVNDEINMVLRLMGQELRELASFSAQLQSDLPPIKAPRNAISQAITNLLLNALHAVAHRPRNQQTIRIESKREDDFVIIEVKDNGHGVTPEMAGRIFDPFFTTKIRGEGAGLGLAITRQLVEAMNGEILLESFPDQGAKFSIYVEAQTGVQAVERRFTPAPPSSERLRILLVDDDALFLSAEARILQRDFDVTTAATGTLAKEILKDDPTFDAILADLLMPDVDGIALFDWLQVQHPEIAQRVIFITGGIKAKPLRDALEATGRPHLTKPVQKSVLVESIRKMRRDATRRSGTIEKIRPRLRTRSSH